MLVKEVGLSWIVVKDVKVAIDYYSNIIGLKVVAFSEEYGWAELIGHEGGCHIGISKENSDEPVKAGQNAVMTFTVDNLVQAKADAVKKGAKADGNIIEIPGHVKMQSFLDHDGNRFQLCELEPHSCEHC